MKKIVRHPAITFTIAMILAVYGKLIFATCRVHYLTPIPPELKQGPVMLVAWHQQIIMLPALSRPSPYKLLAMMSASRDGTLIRFIAAWFGIGAAIGSSHRGAVSGVRRLVHAARNGKNLFITPDGPRGPATIAKPGATEVARITGLPLIPAAAWPTHGKTFRSWDQFRLPYPFTTISVAYGTPLATLTPEALQAALNTLTVQAQAAVSLATPSPKL